MSISLEPEMTMDKLPFLHPHTEKEPYELSLHMKQLDEDVYEFQIEMDLYKDAHYISPFAKGDFKGKFMIEIDETNILLPISMLKEVPPSKEEYDPHPFVDGMVNWVREDTKYLQQFQRTSDEDFELRGLIQFTIEPRCTLEKVPIIIKYKNEKLVAEFFGC